MDNETMNITDRTYRVPEADEMQKEAEKESRRKLAEAERREQERLNKRTFFDKIWDAIFKVKKKSADIDIARAKDKSNVR